MPTDLKAVPGPTEEEILTLPFAEETINISGREFRFRELTVEENDQCADASKNKDGVVIGRTMMRLMILAAAIEPKLTAESLAKMPQRAYIKIYDLVNRLNSVPLDEDDEEAGKI